MSLEEAKRLGNEHLKAGRLGEAVAQYSECITLAPNDAVYWSNRSAAYAALQRWDEALADGHTAADLRPDWSKAHSVRHRRVQSPSPSNSSYPRALPARLGLEHPRSWAPAPLPAEIPTLSSLIRLLSPRCGAAHRIRLERHGQMS
jgi:tetratricopeptide (TPR) repeat protein